MCDCLQTNEKIFSIFFCVNENFIKLNLYMLKYKFEEVRVEKLKFFNSVNFNISLKHKVVANKLFCQKI